MKNGTKILRDEEVKLDQSMRKSYKKNNRKKDRSLIKKENNRKKHKHELFS